jgi:hypothetical protein
VIRLIANEIRKAARLYKRPILEAPCASAGISLRGSIALAERRNALLRERHPSTKEDFLKLFLPIALFHEFHN